MNNFKNKIPIIAGILFLMANVIAVLSAWITDTHRYDLGISFSAYVGLSRPTSVVWFVSAVIIITMLIYYIAKTKIILFKKIIYAVVLLCIFGTALFPYNFFSEAPTAITINLHNDFAICQNKKKLFSDELWDKLLYHLFQEQCVFPYPRKNRHL